MSTPPSPLLAYYADDFTGATDALEWLTRVGLRTVLFLAPPTPEQLQRFPRLQAIGVAGRSRSLAPDAMRAELRPAFTALRTLGAAHVHYKVCSTFDSSPTVGSIGCAMEIGREIFPSDFVPLVVGAPPLGRYCVFGNLFARLGIGSAGAIYRLDRHPSMSRHPVTPADESDLQVHLARQTQLKIALFDVLQLALPEAERQTALSELARRGAEVVLFDALTNDHLSRIGALLDLTACAERPLFSVGSSAIEMALGSVWHSRGELPTADAEIAPGPVDRLLVVSGSCSPVTERQVAWAAAHGFLEVGLESSAWAGADASSPEAAAMEVVDCLNRGRSVVVHTLRGGRDPALIDGTQRLGAAFAALIRTAAEKAGLKRAVIAGGDTSSYVARSLGIEALEMIAPLAPGAPLCRVASPGHPLDGTELNIKGGQVGADDYFDAVRRGTI
jgi:3-oxoisoapionate kinase